MDYYREGGTTPHLRLVLFEEPSFLVGFSKYYEYTVAQQNNEYTVAKQNGGGAEWVELFITLTKGMGEPTYGRTLAVSHHVLELEACSARPASKVLRWTFAGYSGLVVRLLSRGKYIILCESSRSAGCKWDVLLLVTGYLT